MAIATAESVRAGGHDEDMPPLLDALERLGVAAEASVWDDPGVGWAGYDLVVVRSTWDYVPQRGAFLAWAERVGGETLLLNPAPVVAWSTDKRYLEDLGAAGVPVVPTTVVVPGDAVALPDVEEVVVKPSVSAGAMDSGRYRLPSDRAAAEAHLRRLLDAGRDAPLQPYLRAVETAAETAVVHIGGRFSHAIRKGPLLGPGREQVAGLYVEETIEARTPSAGELSVAEAAVDAVPGGPDQLLYARVDLLPGPEGTPLVLELELAEPSLFLTHAPGAADRLAASIVAHLD